MAACGLDFGTSNTTLGVADPEGPILLPLEGAHRTIPSAIFFELGREPVIGRAATAAYVEGLSGRLMRGLKSVLGTPLMEEATPVGRQRLRLRDIIARYLAAVKDRAETASGRSLDSVVHGRPVHFVDGDPEADRRAEDTLRAIARDVGFREVSFQYEPIAAALDYERQVRSEEIALVADIGGGTSDFSIVRLSPERRGRADRAGDILANDGVRIGGTDFDRQLSLGTVMPLLGLGSPMRRGDLAVPNAYFHDLATWSAINRLYNSKTLREIDEVVRDCARRSRASAGTPWPALWRAPRSRPPRTARRTSTSVSSSAGWRRGSTAGLSPIRPAISPAPWPPGSTAASRRRSWRRSGSTPCSSPAAQRGCRTCAPR